MYNYRTFELDEKCMSAESAAEVEDLYKEVKLGGVGIMRVLYDIYQLSYMVNKHCYFFDVTHDILSFCGTGHCYFQTVSQNVMTNFFKITAAANDLA